MKNYIYIAIIIIVTTFGKLNAQKKQNNLNEEGDTFTYERIDVANSDSGELLLSGTRQSAKNSDTNSAINKTQNTGTEETEGNLSVSLTGGAQYDIPIMVPPGIKDIVPEVALTYNSQSGNGLAGYGWNLRGVSVISRVQSTKFHDDNIDPTDFDPSDRFALDGERLMLKSGTYGGNGAEYETESYSNLKITSHGTSIYGAHYGPKYFIVRYPDGSKAYYGNTNGSASPMNYAISYWENPQGIRLDYEYYKSNNSLSINKIKYGGNSPNNHINEVRFVYNNSTTRRPAQQAYIGGVNFRRTNLLIRIEVYANNNLYRKYVLGNNNQTNLDYNRLTSIREYSGNGQSHTPIYFNYSNTNSSVSYNGITTIGLNNVEQRNAETVSLDITGNGKMDFIVYPKNNKNKFWLFKNIQNGGSFNYPWTINTGTFEEVFPTTWLNHQNKILSGKGLTVVQNGSNNTVRFKTYSNGTTNPIYHQYTKTWNAPTYTYYNSPNSSTQRRIPMKYISGDFNGDGLTDVLAIGKPYTSRYCYYHGDCDDPDPCDDDVIISPIGDPCWDVFQRNSEQLEETRNIDKYYNKNVNVEIDKTLEISKPFDVETFDKNSISNRSFNNCSYSCYSSTSNYRSVYFVNLDRNITSNFANYAGYLSSHLKNDDQLFPIEFDGDGKTDLLHITDGKLYVYTLDNNNRLVKLWENLNSHADPTKAILIGDFNGDGLTDYMRPQPLGSGSNRNHYFRTYFSTGKSFQGTNTSYKPFEYRETNWNGQNGVLSGYNLIPLDINGDGRTDIIEYNTTTYNGGSNGSQTIKIYNNIGVYGNSNLSYLKYEYGGVATKNGYLRHFPIPIFLSSNSPNKNLEFASISDNAITNFSFNMDHREDVLLRSINNNGVTQSISYSNLDPSEYGDSWISAYQQSYNSSYPYVDMVVSPGSKIVTKLQRSSSGTTTLKKIYSYKGAIQNLNGLGFMGFEGIAESEWHANNSSRVVTVSKYDPQLRGALVLRYSKLNYFSFNEPSSNYISKTSYQYSSSLSSNKVFTLKLDSSLNQNQLEQTYTNVTYQYDGYNNPTNIYTNYSGVGNTTTIVNYANNEGSEYYIGRVMGKTETSNIGSETFSSESEYSYTDYLLTERKTKGHNTPFDRELFEYDTYGNLTKKTIIPNGEAPRFIEFDFDSSGRYLEKSTDVEGLETSYEYDYSKGWLTKTINPFGLDTSYNYDHWDRLVKEVDYLDNEINTSYSESNNIYTVNETADDGSGRITVYDRLKRITKVSEKNVLGQWVNTSFEYDNLDRLIKESEPYTGSNPTQWNETSYDIYDRPISQTLHTGRTINISYNGLTVTVDDGVKTVTTTYDAMKNTVSVTDPGGTINYQYYGNGNLKSTSYNGIVVSIERDGWGRKTKLIDPSAGVYEYNYNGFGEIIDEITPKGTTNYTYSPIGKVLQKSISGDDTDMSIVYNYHPQNKFVQSISLTSADGNNSTYNYNYDNNYSRLTSISETTPFAQFTKSYGYDTFGRVETEEYVAQLLSNSKTSTKKIKNVYQNGDLKSIKDFNTNQNIWDLTGVNARGQATETKKGNNKLLESINYNAYGYSYNTSVRQITSGSPNLLMSLSTSFDTERGTLESRTNSMFSWSETFEYDDLDRLIAFNDNDGNNTQSYDDLGRITSNNTVGNYNYNSTSFKLTNLELNTQGDLHYQQNPLQQVKFNAFKKPFEINEAGKEKIGFQYNAFNGRSNMFYGDTEKNIYDRNNRKHYSYDGSMEISYDEDEGRTLFVTYIGGDPYDAPAIWRSEQNNSGAVNNGYYHLHRDYLGSIMLITDDNGNPKEKRHFDAWGKLVKLTDGNNNSLEEFKILDRGYTGHEHLQGVNLIHMNGRIYDPNLRRFLSPDNFIQDIHNTQNYNRYGYVLNNPLMYVDINGEELFTVIALVAVIVSAAIGTYALITNFSDQSGGSSNSDPSQDGPLSSTNQNNSQEIASSIPKIPGSGYRLDYTYNYGNLAISTEHNSIGNNSVASQIGQAMASAMFGDVANGNNIGGGDTDGGITTADVVDTALDFVPIAGGINDIRKGIRDGDGWQVALGVGSIVLDIFTLGSSSLVKGAVKTGIKQGVKAYSKRVANNTLKKIGSSLPRGGKTFKKYKSDYWKKRSGTSKAKKQLEPLRNPNNSQDIYKQYEELHHRFIAQRHQKRYNLPNWLVNNRINLQRVNTLDHARKDIYRAIRAPAWAKKHYNLRTRR